MLNKKYKTEYITLIKKWEKILFGKSGFIKTVDDEIKYTPPFKTSNKLSLIKKNIKTYAKQLNRKILKEKYSKDSGILIVLNNNTIGLEIINDGFCDNNNKLSLVHFHYNDNSWSFSWYCKIKTLSGVTCSAWHRINGPAMYIAKLNKFKYSYHDYSTINYEFYINAQHFDECNFNDIIEQNKDQYTIKLSNNEKEIINNLLNKNYLILADRYYKDNSYLQPLLNEFIKEGE